MVIKVNKHVMYKQAITTFIWCAMTYIDLDVDQSLLRHCHYSYNIPVLSGLVKCHFSMIASTQQANISMCGLFQVHFSILLGAKVVKARMGELYFAYQY